MNKIIIIVFSLLVIGSGAYLLLIGDDADDAAPMAQTSETTNIDPEESSTESTTKQANSVTGYVDYSEENLQASSDTTRVLFFHAPWCPTCVFFEGQIEEQGVPDGVTILKIDFDSETELKNKYGVTVQSTFVQLDSNGETVQSWPFSEGLNGIDDLYSAL